VFILRVVEVVLNNLRAARARLKIKRICRAILGEAIWSEGTVFKITTAARSPERCQGEER
jgi:hypothetical protein